MTQVHVALYSELHRKDASVEVFIARKTQLERDGEGAVQKNKNSVALFIWHFCNIRNS